MEVGAFTARLQALAGAHDVLTNESWVGAELGQILRVALAPFQPSDGGNRLGIEGPQVWLKTRAAVAIALSMHELATNAMKYGSLSSQDGAVDVRWRLERRDGDERLALSGRNARVRRRSALARGFGSRLIEIGLAAELQGSVEMRYAPDGLVCEVDAPLAFIGKNADGDIA